MTDDAALTGDGHSAPALAATIVKRHRLPTRIWHWVNAVTLLIMLMSGLMIFNAHPRLYWGQDGANHDPAWLQIGASGPAGQQAKGYVEIAGKRFGSDGVLGRWDDAEGISRTRAFPYWATIPSNYSLADARLWHLAFAWILALAMTAYMAWTLLGRHIRDLHIRRAEWSPGHLWQDIKDHARLRFPTGAAALEYNILQKLAYISVIFVMLPLMVATGLSMSPGINASAPWLIDLFGGRQSARSIHFIVTWALVGFFLVHMAMVLLAGPINEVRSIITGWYRVPQPKVAAEIVP